MQGYNYVFKKSVYGEKIDMIKKILDEKGFDTVNDKYGLFFRSEDHEKIMEELENAELL